jgi:hypothetical protein
MEPTEPCKTCGGTDLPLYPDGTCTGCLRAEAEEPNR